MGAEMKGGAVLAGISAPAQPESPSHPETPKRPPIGPESPIRTFAVRPKPITPGPPGPTEVRSPRRVVRVTEWSGPKGVVRAQGTGWSGPTCARGCEPARAKVSNSRPPTMTAPRKHNATAMNAAAVPWPATTRRAIPTATVTTHTTRPLSTAAGGRRATVNQPPATPTAKGQAVETKPPTVSPW
jgi:hypothetical protein